MGIIFIKMCSIITKYIQASKVKYGYLLRTVKKRAITTAAVVIATNGSNRFERNGSDGISPFVNG